MTIITTKKDVQARIRARRRRIAGARNGIKNGKTRRLAVIAGMCLIVMLGGYFGVRGEGFAELRHSSGAYAAEETVYKKVTVYSGDTLWGIAGEYTEPSKDVRKMVKAICDLNNVSPGKIYPGQVILVPVSAHLA